MQTEYFIAVDEFCAYHNIESSFINSLQQTGLLELTPENESGLIAASQLQQLEKIVRLYYELDINLEGIESITHLLQRIISLQDENKMLRNRLHLYEADE